MAKFVRDRGDTEVFAYKKKASTAFADGDAVMLDSNGFLVPADASATPETLVGIINGTVTSANDDYADTNEYPVEQPSEDAVYKAKVGAGTPAQNMVGQRYDLDSNGEVDLTSQTNKVVEVVRLAQDSDYIYVKFV